LGLSGGKKDYTAKKIKTCAVRKNGKEGRRPVVYEKEHAKKSVELCGLINFEKGGGAGLTQRVGKKEGDVCSKRGKSSDVGGSYLETGAMKGRRRKS